MNQEMSKNETVRERLCRIRVSHSLTGAFGNVPARVLPADSRQKFELKILDPEFQKLADVIDVKYIRDDWRMDDGSVAQLSQDLNQLWQKVPSFVSDGVLPFELGSGSPRSMKMGPNTGKIFISIRWKKIS